MELPKEVAKHFDCDNVCQVITRAPERLEVDLSKITLKEARELHAKGLLPMLKPKPTTTAALTTAAKEDNTES